MWLFEDWKRKFKLKLINFRNVYEATIDNRTLDVPYGDHFYHTEKWFITSTSEHANKVIMRAHN